MQKFADLFLEIDSTTSTNEKIEAMSRYFSKAEPKDLTWAVLLLSGRIGKRLLTGLDLRRLFVRATGYSEWLLDECQAEVGDSAETLSLLARNLGLCLGGPRENTGFTLSYWMEERIPKLAEIEDETERAAVLMSWWKELTQLEVFILNKLMTGVFRVGVSERLLVRALANALKVEVPQMAHRLTGLVAPDLRSGSKVAHTVEELYERLTSMSDQTRSSGEPYPFCLAQSWGEREEKEFEPEKYICEWKYDGIRAQAVKKEGEVWVWSRGEDNITKSFPDLVKSLSQLKDGTVLDGEVVVLIEGKVRAFNDLQKRIGRKTVSKNLLASHPAGFIAYDCLEFENEDIRSRSLGERKQALEKALEVKPEGVLISPVLNPRSVEDLYRLRSQARDANAEGLMIKLKEAPYGVGRKTGIWWKFKVEPYTLDAVLIYAQAGSGRRANLYTDYTFALRDGEGQYVPFAKAYSGLDQKEIDELDRWIRTHTIEKFGPVRSVQPLHVFEIGFEGISKSTRHKSGIAVRFPRILRWRKDKPATEADSLSSAERLLHPPVGVAHA